MSEREDGSNRPTGAEEGSRSPLPFVTPSRDASVMFSILIIEHDGHIRSGMAELCELEFERCITLDTDDNWHGLELARQYHPDVILIDISGVHGGETLPQLMEENPGAKVIVMALYTQRRSGSILPGVQDVLWKPFTAEEMLSVVKGVYVYRDRVYTPFIPLLRERLFSSMSQLYESRRLIDILKQMGTPDALHVVQEWQKTHPDSQ